MSLNFKTSQYLLHSLPISELCQGFHTQCRKKSLTLKLNCPPQVKIHRGDLDGKNEAGGVEERFVPKRDMSRMFGAFWHLWSDRIPL